MTSKKMVATNETPLDAGATNYPGAFAQPRLWAAEACPGRAGRFRRVDDFNCASVALPRLNINGTDTYQFVVGNPVGRVDPSDFDCEEYLREHQKALQEAAKAQREIQKDLEKLNTCPPPSLLKRVAMAVRAFNRDYVRALESFGPTLHSRRVLDRLRFRCYRPITR